MGIYVTGIGIITALGRGCPETAASLRKNRSGLAPLTLFPHGLSFAVGEIKEAFVDPDLPRTHQIARAAALDALAACGGKVPEAVVMGMTTGGMPKTETLLQSGADDPDLYRFHASGSVANYIAGLCKCDGPAFTVSTACSSGAGAVALGAKLLQCGLFKSVLAGGADALCRLTYHGFNALQLLSPDGAAPFDRDRNGMSLSEGAAMLFMESAEQIPENALAEIRGLGLSCDAYHAASPHPEGQGALAAMDAAIRDAGLVCADIDYINLHGTGTISNDASEAKAVNRLFGKDKPPLSSIKGASGHSLAAAGAVELAVCIIAIAEKLVPANHGLKNPDPALDLCPQREPGTGSIRTVLSNSFGFGGNNAALVVSAPPEKAPDNYSKPVSSMAVMGNACVTGAGKMSDTARSFMAGSPCSGTLSIPEVSAGLPPGALRRLKRLPRLALCLADDAIKSAGLKSQPSGVFFSTGWGALTETDDFLTRLFKNQERFSSPMDFVGSVHNAPAGEIAMMFNVTGPNITMTGGDYSFEQALIAASLMQEETEEPFLVIGADECHPRLSSLFDPSVLQDTIPADGGGGLCLARSEKGLQLRPVFYRKADDGKRAVMEMIDALGGEKAVRERYGALFAGIPASCREAGERQVNTFQRVSGSRAPVVDYRKHTGEFASASAAAVSLAVYCVQQDLVPPHDPEGNAVCLNGGAILVMGTGTCLTAVEVFRP
ncbi:MAG: beta-ketoacyl-[acyl-carrier-protein] synthase family protein [Thermodesulfobacteriota bacterium]